MGVNRNCSGPSGLDQGRILPTVCSRSLSPRPCKTFFPHPLRCAANPAELPRRFYRGKGMNNTRPLAVSPMTATLVSG